MTKKAVPSKPSAQEREERRAAALRSNLRRRKEQIRARTETETPPRFIQGE